MYLSLCHRVLSVADRPRFRVTSELIQAGVDSKQWQSRVFAGMSQLWCALLASHDGVRRCDDPRAPRKHKAGLIKRQGTENARPISIRSTVAAASLTSSSRRVRRVPSHFLTRARREPCSLPESDLRVKPLEGSFLNKVKPVRKVGCETDAKRAKGNSVLSMPFERDSTAPTRRDSQQALASLQFASTVTVNMDKPLSAAEQTASGGASLVLKELFAGTLGGMGQVLSGQPVSPRV